MNPESCNGVDDDGNGQTDELGVFTCGIGACTTTVQACIGGHVSACLPADPTPGPDGCDGVDSDCDGAVDEDCGDCLHVATDGDDDSAVASSGAAAFATLQVAIDFAASSPGAPRQVCVAPGASCGATAAFPGPASADLQMADGIDVLANYESTTWTRCADSTTHLVPQTGRGVVFPASIASQTVLDGFAIDRPAAITVAGVTVDGALGAVLSNLTIEGGAGAPSYSYGVDVMNGADATIFRSRIDDGSPADQEAVAVRAVGARVSVEDSCPSTPDGSGHCLSNVTTAGFTCATTGPQIAFARNRAFSPYPPSRGIVLHDAPGSRVERSAVCGEKLVSESAGIEVSGDAAGVVIRADSVDVKAFGYLGHFGLNLEDCAGASPWIVDHTSINMEQVISFGGSGPLNAVVRAAGDCHPVIESNGSVSGTLSEGPLDAIRCDESGGVGSRCVISHEEVALGQGAAGFTGTSAGLSVAAIRCVGSSCARIDHDRITGWRTGSCSSPQCSGGTTGIQLAPGGATLVSTNIVYGTEGYARSSTAVAANGGGARLENNVLVGTPLLPGAETGATGGSYLSSSTAFAGVAELYSNYLIGSTATSTHYANCSNRGFLLQGSGAVFRNNIIAGGACGYSIERQDGVSEPAIFEDNAVYNGPPVQGGENSAGVVFFDSNGYESGTDFYFTAAEIDAFTALHASGTLGTDCAPTNDGHLSVGSPCIDAGVATGAPVLDMDGDARDATPDIGPDEYR